MLGLWTGVSDNWEDCKRLSKDFFVEFLELRLSYTNVVTSRIFQLKAPRVAMSLGSGSTSKKISIQFIAVVLPKVS